MELIGLKAVNSASDNGCKWYEAQRGAPMKERAEQEDRDAQEH
jgi:hypothetical protein